MHRCLLAVFLSLQITWGAGVFAQAKQEAQGKQTVYSFSLVDLNGKVVPLASYKGKVLLIVNLASQSEFHSQIEALNELQKAYAADGLVVIGVPSSDFGDEELKDNDAIRKYYTETVKPLFPVFARATLHGVAAIPLYEFLCNAKTGLAGGDVHWNFTKFLIDRQGNPLARYEAGVDPADIDFHVTMEKALAGKLKKQSEAKGEASGGDDDDDE